MRCDDVQWEKCTHWSLSTSSLPLRAPATHAQKSAHFAKIKRYFAHVNALRRIRSHHPGNLYVALWRVLTNMSCSFSTYKQYYSPLSSLYKYILCALSCLSARAFAAHRGGRRCINQKFKFIPIFFVVFFLIFYFLSRGRFSSRVPFLCKANGPKNKYTFLCFIAYRVCDESARSLA